MNAISYLIYFYCVQFRIESYDFKIYFLRKMLTTAAVAAINANSLGRFIFICLLFIFALLCVYKFAYFYFTFS